MNQRSLPWRPVLILLLVAAGFGAAMLLDRPVFHMLDWPKAEREDWHRLFRACGSLTTWALAAAAVLLLRRPRAGAIDERDTPTVGAYLLLAPVAAGLLAEPLKLLLRRERPDAEALAYSFRSFAEGTLRSANLGLPSSHAAIAFAGSAALCVVAPRAAPVWIAAAVGCGFTRIADRAHWFSDVYAGAALGVAAAWAVARLMRIRGEPP